MMQVQDLRLEKDVLPFFNFTNNDHSEARLLSFLWQVPETEAEVLERQAITKGIISNWQILEGFTYRKLDLLEVHATFKIIQLRESTIKDGKLKASLKLMLSAEKRNKRRSNLIQLILLLNGIQKQYLNRLRPSYFPESFSNTLQLASGFLNKLRLERNADLINEGRFGVTEIVEFTNLLHELDPVEINSFWEFFFTFEAYWSLGKAALINGFSFPAFTKDHFILEEFYHPLVKQPVKNTLQLEPGKNVLLLTGPNMSGKSTLLKSIGLCIYLARVGLSVPASDCQIPFFKTVAIAINLNDNLKDGYSHFMAEVENLKAVVQATENSQKSFAVFDEIFRGTNVDDALDITKSTIDGLSKIKDSYFLISTHLLKLEDHLDISTSGSIKKCFIECNLEQGIPKFSYRLKEGWSQLKIGSILFKQSGLKEMLESKV